MTLWDVDTGMPVNEYEAHDKRIWSVDFCTADSSLFVSGSDDGWIKAGLCHMLISLKPVFATLMLPHVYQRVVRGLLHPLPVQRFHSSTV